MYNSLNYEELLFGHRRAPAAAVAPLRFYRELHQTGVHGEHGLRRADGHTHKNKTPTTYQEKSRLYWSIIFHAGFHPSVPWG
ncbi:hypothetical protein AOLI_G00083520 [Acnodon oligacanthus]